MGIFYGLLNEHTGNVLILSSPIDSLIPFIPSMIVPYLGWYPFVFIAMAYLCLKDRTVYIRALLTMNICAILCYIIYYYFQTSVPRPLFVPHGWADQMLLKLYERDQPFNCFPSIHALHSYVIMRAAIASKSISTRVKMLISAGSITIILSTFMIKQHVIYDAIAASLLGEMVFIAVAGLAFSLTHRKKLAAMKTFNLPR